MVAINRFSSDSKAEVDMVVNKSTQYGAFNAVIAEHWAFGGSGAVQLAQSVIDACQMSSKFK